MPRTHASIPKRKPENKKRIDACTPSLKPRSYRKKEFCPISPVCRGCQGASMLPRHVHLARISELLIRLTSKLGFSPLSGVVRKRISVTGLCSSRYRWFARFAFCWLGGAQSSCATKPDVNKLYAAFERSSKVRSNLPVQSVKVIVDLILVRCKWVRLGQAQFFELVSRVRCVHRYETSAAVCPGSHIFTPAFENGIDSFNRLYGISTDILKDANDGLPGAQRNVVEVISRITARFFFIESVTRFVNTPVRYHSRIGTWEKARPTHDNTSFEMLINLAISGMASK